MRQPPVTILIVASFVAAVLIDIVTPGYDATILYAIPLIVGARFGSPRLIAALAVASILAQVFDLYRGDVPLAYWPFGVIALGAIALLAAQVAELRQRERRRVQEAEAAREQLREFMGMVVHDLRGPLTVATGYVQLVRRQLASTASESALGTIDRIDRALRSSNRLVSDLLDSTRIGGGRFVVHPETADLAEIARTVVEEQRVGAADRTIAVEAPASLSGAWDPDRLRQVVTNLVSNAIKYSPSGADVAVVVRSLDERVLMSVADRGPGLASDQVSQLFQPFARLAQDREATGTGLGLYITKGIVEAHGGRIWVESAVGVGSTFYVELPCRRDGESVENEPASLGDRSGET